MNDVWLFAGQVASLSLPILIAGVTLILSLKFNWFAVLNFAVDGGSNILGRNKTWRGVSLYLTVTTLVTWSMHLADFTWALPIYRENPLVLGLAMSSAYVAGEFANSFVKRRLGIGPGEGSSGLQKLFDTVDGMLCCGLVLLIGYQVPISYLAASLLVSISLHLSTDALMRHLGLKKQK